MTKFKRIWLSRLLVVVFSTWECSGAFAASSPFSQNAPATTKTASCAIFFAEPISLEPASTPDPVATIESLGRYARENQILNCLSPSEALNLLQYYGDQNREKSVYQSMDREIDRAKEHWLNFEFDEALSVIEHAIVLIDQAQLAKSGADFVPLGEKKVEALLVKALIEKAQGKKAALTETFKSALAVNPKLSIDELQFPPSYIEGFTKVKDSLYAAPVGGLKIESSPGAAAVYLNGVPFGATPLSVDALPAGHYTVAIATNRYQTAYEDVTIAPGESAYRRVLLKFKPNAKEGVVAENPLILKARSGEDRETALLSTLKEALVKAKALAVDKALLLTETSGSALQIRVLDVGHEASHRPIEIPLKTLGSRFNWKALEPMFAQIVNESVLNNPGKSLDPRTGDLVVLRENKKPFYRKPIFWVGVGLAVAGGVTGGILATRGSDESRTPDPEEGGVGVGLGGF